MMREMFNQVIATQTDPDKIAKLELCREYFCNPEFKAWLQDFVWAANQEK